MSGPVLQGGPFELDLTGAAGGAVWADYVTAGLTVTVGEASPGADALVLPDVGHLAFLEQPATVASAWLRLVARERIRV